MPITIGSNIASLNAQRRLSESSAQISKTFERLSSGSRINSAADDAAGLAISESLKSDRRVFNQGVRNFNDGLSLLNIADGAIGNLSDIIIRLKELAEQSANGTYGVSQRAALDNEAQALSKEYSRIARSTTFNGRNLFDASFGDLRLQGGFGESGGIQSSLGGAIGLGTFGAATSYAAETGSSDAVALGDLNADGILDMVTTGNVVGTVSIRLGQAGGSFASVATYNIGVNTTDLALGDFNNDGRLDIVASGANGVNLLFGSGNGTFGSVTTLAMDNSGSNAVAVGDLNNDGNLDIITAGISVGSTGRVRLGAGNGTFGAAISFNGNVDTDVAVGDLNGDGLLDIAQAGYYGTGGTVGYLFGRGDGTFGSVTNYTSQNFGNSTTISIADLNNDGRMDIINGGVNGSASGEVSYRLNNGSGTFANLVTLSTGSDSVDGLGIGDYNGDGFADIIAGGSGGAATTLLSNTGRGAFNTLSQILNAGNATSVAVGDVNSDGVNDIVVNQAGVNSNRVLINNTKAGISSLLNFKLTTQADSLQAFSQFDKALSRLSVQRGTIGAFQSRVAVAGNVLTAASENYAAAAGRILDADIAAESANLIRNKILQQAATSVLAQANLQPSLAIDLLG